ncbi:MAG TPA: HD domain-containing phosphohydrolase [Vicinamibacterales bacterium]|jgi:putative nucleotidyltransferase with HDIG domain
MTTPSPQSAPSLDPLLVLKGLASLRRLAGTYPAGHPSIVQKLTEIQDALAKHFRTCTEVRIDIIQGEIFLDGASFSGDVQAHAPIVRELVDLGVDSVYVREGVQPAELLAVAECLWATERSKTETLNAQLASRGVQSVSLGHLVPLDTRWRAQQWPDAPTGPLDPAYAESLVRAQETFESVAAGNRLDAVTIGDLVQLLLTRVARSHAALGQILAVKQYENLTYCHSVNVSLLSLIIGRQVGLDDATLAALVEAALLHDIGKTRIPLDIVKKPGALDKRERKMIEAHTTLGAEILVQTDGLRPLTPTVALEHHRGVNGTGYPELATAVPHIMSQMVSVADIYEALTGARSYQDPMQPERACLVLARLAGDKLNTSLVKAFVKAITFFPMGSLVRTSLGEFGVVVAVNGADPLHPTIDICGADFGAPERRIDTSARDSSGNYHRHIAETLPASEGFDILRFLPVAA